MKKDQEIDTSSRVHNSTFHTFQNGRQKMAREPRKPGILFGKPLIGACFKTQDQEIDTSSRVHNSTFHTFQNGRQKMAREPRKPGILFGKPLIGACFKVGNSDCC